MSHVKNIQKSRIIKGVKKRNFLYAQKKFQEEVVQLSYATKGDSLCDWYDGGERDGWSQSDWEPNCSWAHTQLRRRDIPEFLAAYRQYLAGCWTPNQGSGHGTCGYDGTQDIREGEATMQRLADEAKESILRLATPA